MREEGGGELEVEVRVWDLPVRLFHWALALLLVFQLVSGKLGGAWMKWHAYFGYAVLALVIFRILWGFGGSTLARFAAFVKGPVATWRFARRLFSREAVPQLGHNPLGGWMVLALLAAFAFQVGTGLFSNDGYDVEGPFAPRVSLELSDQLSRLHRSNAWVLLALVGVHLAAVVFHRLVKRENLFGAMVTGVKRVPAALLRERRLERRATPPRRVASREPASLEFASAWRAAAYLAAAVLAVIALVRLPV